MPADCEICPTEIWLAALRAQGRSPATIKSYRRAIGQLWAWRTDGGLTTLTRLKAIAFTTWMGEHKPGRVALCVRSLRAGWSTTTRQGTGQWSLGRVHDDRARG